MNSEQLKKLLKIHNVLQSNDEKPINMEKDMGHLEKLENKIEKKSGQNLDAGNGLSLFFLIKVSGILLDTLKALPGVFGLGKKITEGLNFWLFCLLIRSEFN